ncbi:LysR family transcriptional regulator [Pseudonocardia sp. C8]|uniref:LysR family transcriptional regulator n=1 Tax=Pseudonocardia sp. C8 TaxID=2762759 RepID=UPI00164235E5|nr:LysR family transcriptional regulator [Pseudonocardia sp. C8]MBC3193663.1 LysR family transcriptional regulator [Pseudonocardia sp. C8]
MAGDVQLRQLEYLVALARERHFGRAAAACHASQSTLSSALRALERQLGVTIVQRDRRFQGFTGEGERVVGWAHRILAERDALRTDLDRLRHGLTATVRIGAIPTAVPATSVLTLAWVGAYPQARTRIDVFSAREIHRLLTEFELDVGLTYVDPGATGSHVLPLYRERYLLLTPDRPALDGRDTLAWREAAGLRLCALSRGMRNREIVDGALVAAGVTPQVDVEADTVAALYAHLATGQWSAVIAHTWLRAFGVPAGMRALPLDDPGSRPVVGLVLGDRGPASHVARAFLDAVETAGVGAELERDTDAGSVPVSGPR